MPSVVARSKWSALIVYALALYATAGPAGAGETPPPEPLALSALSGPAGTDLYITAPPGATALEQVHVRIALPEAPDETIRTLNLKDVAVAGGTAAVDLGHESRGSLVRVDAHVRQDRPSRTTIHRGRTTVQLRPDLTVTAVHAPPQTLTTRPVDVVADLAELNGETETRVTATLMLGPTPLAESQLATVPAGGTASVTFAGVELETPASTKLTVVLDAAAPFETDETNNTGTADVEVTEHELVRSNVLVPSLGGFGVQLNQHVYAPVTNAPATSLPDLEEKVKALEPQLVRIFYNDDFEERQPNRVKNLASFVETVGLAHGSGATINVTYQAVNVAKTDPLGSMGRFAAVLEDLVEVRGYTNLRWVTVANEPNSTNVTMAEYNALYRALDAELAARGLRSHIGLMGGDLIRDNQRLWFQYIAANMNDILDAYSVHIYWDYWNMAFASELRLKDVRKIVTEELPEAARKPVYVTESGVRGILNMAGKPAVQPGYWADGTPIGRTNIAAFQQLWFDLAAAQLGFTGSVKWDAYWGRYHGNYNAAWYLIGPASEGWPLFPSYHALRLLLQTTQLGWQALQVAPWEEDDWKMGVPDEREKEIVAYADERAHLTLMGLDTNGRDLNAATAETVSYSIGGLPPSRAFSLALWNAAGNGENSVTDTIATDAAGVARFTVPLHAAFSLTTVPVS